MRPNEVPDVPGASHGASQAARGLAAVIRGYQLAFSWLFAGSCRFTPSCSEYARLAVLGHGAPKGAWLALRRLLRCLPLGGYGFDPVPEGRAAVASTRRL